MPARMPGWRAVAGRFNHPYAGPICTFAGVITMTGFAGLQPLCDPLHTSRRQGIASSDGLIGAPAPAEPALQPRRTVNGTLGDQFQARTPAPLATRCHDIPPV